MQTNGFDLKTCCPTRVPLHGPIPLELRLTYQGASPIEIASLEGRFLDLSIDTPTGWAANVIRGPITLVGPLSILKLAKGESVSRIVYLHDLFSGIIPGEARLSLTLRVWPDGGEASEPVVLTSTLSLDIYDEPSTDVETRVASIGSRIERTHDPARRVELLRSLLSVEHPRVIPVLMLALRDHAMLEAQTAARDRSARLCDAADNWDPVIEHLVRYGDRGDEDFFIYWKRKDIVLSDSQVTRLSSASSLWVQLYTLECFPKQRGFEGLRASLQAETADLIERVDCLTPTE